MNFKNYKKENLALLLITWTIFLIWELQVIKWAETVKGPIIRVDLVVILPGIIILSYYLLRGLKKNNNL